MRCEDELATTVSFKGARRALREKVSKPFDLATPPDCMKCNQVVVV